MKLYEFSKLARLGKFGKLDKLYTPNNRTIIGNHHSVGNHTGVKAAAILVVSLGFAGVSGCASHQVSQHISDEGVVTGIAFPKLDKRWDAGSVYPSADSLRQVGPGVSKPQLYQLFGPPHFNEAHGAREWDYLFQFRDAVNGPVKSCQYKVVFDKHMTGQSFYWKPKDCYQKAQTIAKQTTEPRVVYQQVMSQPQPSQPVPQPTTQPVSERFTLDTDALFGFNGSALNDMKPEGRHKISVLAGTLKNYQKQSDISIHVVGHTDYLGDEYRNLALSQLRANTMKQYLIQQGISPLVITSEGMGESQPVTRCNSEMPRPQLIQCLQPNRRVEVIVKGNKNK